MNILRQFKTIPYSDSKQWDDEGDSNEISCKGLSCDIFIEKQSKEHEITWKVCIGKYAHQTIHLSYSYCADLHVASLKSIKLIYISNLFQNN